MKRFLLTVVLSVLITVSAIAQNFYFRTNNMGAWQTTGAACAGCGNAWLTVTRSPGKNAYGYYEYYVWSSTNSFTTRGQACYSYVNGVSVMYQGEDGKWYYPTGFYKFWVIVGEKQVIYTIFHSSPNASIYVGIENIQPYY